MVKAGDKYVDTFPWGQIERFHTIHYKDRAFTLLEYVVIIQHDDTILKGEISYITEDSVIITMRDHTTMPIEFKDIKMIYR